MQTAIQGFRHNDLQPAADAALCMRRRSIPINPYKMPDGRGISFAVAGKNVLDAGLDAGSSGGCLFILLDSLQTEEDVLALIALRNEEYDRYATQQAQA